jgi:hypothetical protein
MPTIVQQKQSYSNLTVTTTILDTPTTIGNLLIGVYHRVSAAVAPEAAGWVLAFQKTSGLTTTAVYAKISDGTETQLSLSNDSNRSGLIIYEVEPDSGKNWESDILNNIVTAWDTFSEVGNSYLSLNYVNTAGGIAITNLMARSNPPSWSSTWTNDFTQSYIFQYDSSATHLQASGAIKMLPGPEEIYTSTSWTVNSSTFLGTMVVFTQEGSVGSSLPPFDASEGVAVRTEIDYIGEYTQTHQVTLPQRDVGDYLLFVAQGRAGSLNPSIPGWDLLVGASGDTSLVFGRLVDGLETSSVNLDWGATSKVIGRVFTLGGVDDINPIVDSQFTASLADKYGYLPDVNANSGDLRFMLRGFISSKIDGSLFQFAFPDFWDSVGLNSTPSNATGLGIAWKKTYGMGLKEGSHIWVDEVRPNVGRSFVIRAADNSNAPEVTPNINLMWAGGQTSSTAKVTIGSSEQFNIARVVYSTDQNLSNPLYSQSIAWLSVEHHNFTVTLSGLTPNTDYYYAVEYDGVLNNEKIGRIRTFPTVGQASSFSIAMSACGNVEGSLDLYTRILSADPLFYFNLGDFPYHDYGLSTAWTQEDWRLRYRNILRNGPFYQQQSTNWIWSDHDGPRGATLAVANDNYRNVFPHHNTIPATTNIYHAYTVGRVRFVVFDTMADGSEGSIGETQLTWGLSQIDAAAADPNIVLLVLVGANVPADGYTLAEKTAIENKLSQVINSSFKGVYIGGDRHMLALDNGTGDMSMRPLPTICAASMGSITSDRGGEWSEGKVYDNNQQYGELKVLDSGTSVTVELNGRDTYTDLPVIPYSFTYSTDGEPPPPSGDYYPGWHVYDFILSDWRPVPGPA